MTVMIFGLQVGCSCIMRSLASSGGPWSAS